ncbi:MAG: hypothetical protein RM338_03860 [Nostoc sp. DedQUE12a]|nr:hypothetical protein [Nostoc sp. DedQUE12a]
MVKSLKNVIVDWGTEADAQEFASKMGGDVQASRAKVCFTVKQGNRKLAVFWNPSEEGKKLRKETYDLAQVFGFSLALNTDITPGILGEKFWKEIIGIDPQKCDKKAPRSPYYYGQKILLKAQEASDEYWSYKYFQEHEPQWLVDRDIKSAFFTSLCQLPTLYLFEHKNGNTTFEPDGGAIDRLRQWSPHLPKWFKHRAFGMLASKKYGTKWGAAFNAASIAVQRVYDAMKVGREITDGYCVRCHTDCFTLKASTPTWVLEKLENFLASKGFELSTKKLGYGQLWDEGFGFIGLLNPIGNEEDVKNQMRLRGLLYKQNAFTDELVNNFGIRLSTHVLYARDRKIYGHWDGYAFFAIVQLIGGKPNGSSCYHAYEMKLEKAEAEAQAQAQAEELIKEL